MKKVVSSLLAATCIATMSVGVMALPNENTQYAPTAAGKYNITVDELNDGTRYGLLAIAADATLATVTDAQIMYINQATAANGTIKFENFIPKNTLLNTPTSYNVFLGGEGLDGAKQIGVLTAQKSVLSLSNTNLSLSPDDTEELTATLNPVDSNVTIAWSIANPEGVTVARIPDNSTGDKVTVTAVADGEATITATASNGETKTCIVTVSSGIPGDMDGQNGLTNADVIYLLNHVNVSKELFPITQNPDVDGQNGLTNADVIYLLNHVNVSKELFPLYPSNN